MGLAQNLKLQVKYPLKRHVVPKEKARKTVKNVNLLLILPLQPPDDLQGVVLERESKKNSKKCESVTDLAVATTRRSTRCRSRKTDSDKDLLNLNDQVSGSSKSSNKILAKPLQQRVQFEESNCVNVQNIPLCTRTRRSRKKNKQCNNEEFKKEGSKKKIMKEIEKENKKKKEIEKENKKKKEIEKEN